MNVIVKLRATFESSEIGSAVNHLEVSTPETDAPGAPLLRSKTIRQGIPPITTSSTGVQNNVIQVRESDFDVLTALSHDIASSRGGATNDDSPSATPGATPVRNDGAGYHENADSDNYLPGGGSPPGDYSRVIPSSPLAGTKLQSGTQSGGNTAGGGQLGSAPPSTTHSSSDSKKALTPPMLPPQLLQVFLPLTTDVS
ncbi:hypothetical protein AHF37_12047 [Paragonimus kellicotti]|nr:hypothetical protein AHF37_12047 [Paragonimus kellicotti]